MAGRCCHNVDLERKELFIEDDFRFKVILTYCKTCGIVRPSTSVIFDGKRDST